ncbi:DUF4139 domain-containing protein [Streptacidiphilus monticola]
MPAPPPPPAERPLLDYAALTLAGPDASFGRGTLVSAPEARAAVAAAPRLPAGAVPVRASAGAYDFRFDAAAPVDLSADGGWHSVTVGEFPVGIALEYLTVPSAEQHVYAAVVVDNGSGVPVLAGPAEVVLDGAYLTTVPFPTLAPGRSRRVGIGVAEEIRVARTLRVSESTAGIRSNTTVLEHRLTVELANQLPRAVVVEVQERVPVSDDRDVRIEDVPSSPQWRVVEPREDETHRRGLRVWRVGLAPGRRSGSPAVGRCGSPPARRSSAETGGKHERGRRTARGPGGALRGPRRGRARGAGAAHRGCPAAAAGPGDRAGRGPQPHR